PSVRRPSGCGPPAYGSPWGAPLPYVPPGRASPARGSPGCAPPYGPPRVNTSVGCDGSAAGGGAAERCPRICALMACWNASNGSGCPVGAPKPPEPNGSGVVAVAAGPPGAEAAVAVPLAAAGAAAPSAWAAPDFRFLITSRTMGTKDRTTMTKTPGRMYRSMFSTELP